MKSKNPSLVSRALFGLALLSVAGISVAGSFPGAHSIHVLPGYPQMNIIDLHFYPSAGVYFSFSSGHYYYPAPRGRHYSRTLPRHIHINPQERIIIHGDMRKPYFRHHDDHYGHRQYQHHRDYRQPDHYGPNNRHRDHDRRDRKRG